MSNKSAVNALDVMASNESYRVLLEQSGLLPIVEQLRSNLENVKDIESEYAMIGFMIVMVDKLKESIVNHNSTNVTSCSVAIASIAAELLIKLKSEELVI